MRQRGVLSKWLITLTLTFGLLATALWGICIQGHSETRAANIDSPAESPFAVPATGIITVEDADSIWQMGTTTPPIGLIDAAVNVLPRVIIEYGNSIYQRDFENPPSGFIYVVSKIGPRVVVEYANSISHRGLEEIPFEEARKGDFDKDGDIDFDDFVAFADCYGSCVGEPNYSSIGDFGDSGCIDFDDFVAFGDVYGTSW